MRITHIFDTHVHADHISGAQELRAASKADIYIHASAPVGYEAKKIQHGDEFKFGYTVLHVLHTPGHTPNSVSFLVTDLARSPEPELILAGDLLFVGDVGRPDLPGEDLMNEQVENLYNSLHDILGTLPDYLEVYPSHGQGSLCGQGMSAKPFTTLGYERRANSMLQHPDLASFKKAILSHTPMRPQSFSSIISSNMHGAALVQRSEGSSCALSAAKVNELHKQGATILDLRDALSYAGAHIPGSISVDFSGGPNLNWLGVAVPPGITLVLILPAGKSFETMCVELQRTGYDKVQGWLKGGMNAWMNSGLPTQSLPYISSVDLRARLASPNPPVMLDVRSLAEVNSLKIEGVIHYPFERLLEGTCPVSIEKETVIVCRSGFRAGIAASLLQARGYSHLSILAGGMNAWQGMGKASCTSRSC